MNEAHRHADALGPDTLVWTERGVVRLSDVVEGDRVALPEGGSAAVRGARRVRAPAVRLALSDGVELVAAGAHRLVRDGDALCWRRVRERAVKAVRLGAPVPALGRPRLLALDYEVGRILGLYAAIGRRDGDRVGFAFPVGEDHRDAELGRFARALGAAARARVDVVRRIVEVEGGALVELLDRFVGGDRDETRWFRPAVYAAPDELRRGVLGGLADGRRSWCGVEQRDTHVHASADLAMFVRRELEAIGRAPRVSRAGAGWRVTCDPAEPRRPLVELARDELGEHELIELAAGEGDGLFLLANGLVAHGAA